MTRKQQREIAEFIVGKGGYIECPEVLHDGLVTCIIKGCDSLFTWEIQKILDLGGPVFYEDGEMKISNWTPMTKELELQSQDTIKFRSFRQGDQNLKLRIVPDPDCSEYHDHVELWCGGDRLGYFHISKTEIHWWPKKRFGNWSMRIDK